VRLGIVTRYIAGDSLYAALRLADWAKAAGHEVSLFTPTRPIRALAPAWDVHVRATQRVAFCSWARTRDVLLWTYRPEIERVRWCAREKVATAALLLWHETHPNDKAVYSEVSRVICPTQAMAQTLGNAWNFNIHEVPWDAGLPLTMKPAAHVPGKAVFVPLFDDTPFRMARTFTHMLRQLLRETSASLTVAYNSATVDASLLRQLDHWRARFKDRVRLCRRVPLNERPLLFAAHDLTLWPTHFENLGVLGLTSLNMGTPVVAFGIKPHTEFLNSNNALIIPCDHECSALRAPRALPDYDKMTAGVSELLSRPLTLGRLQQQSLRGLQNRRYTFEKRLQEIFAEFQN
jgi:hypothetical protein